MRKGASRQEPLGGSMRLSKAKPQSRMAFAPQRPATPVDYEKIFRENAIIMKLKRDVEELQKFRAVEYELKVDDIENSQTKITKDFSEFQENFENS